MMLEKLRVALLAVAASTVVAACARDRAHHHDTFVAGRTLGESTASPGRDHDRPVARSVDTQEVSATISRPPASPSPTGPVRPQAPQPPLPQPQPQPPVAPPPPPPPSNGNPGAFTPPPASPR
jgi:hypothetical protein